MYICDTCKHYYDLFHFGMFCELCQKGNCHYCIKGECDDYEEGEVPEGKERGGYC